MAETALTPDAGSAQPKAALNYRMGGDHCGVCMHYTGVEDGKGTCPKVTPPDVDAGDVCDVFGRGARERDRVGEEARGGSPMVENLQRRGMISDKAMAGLRGRDY